jgi:hypothetical protein
LERSLCPERRIALLDNSDQQRRSEANVNDVADRSSTPATLDF